MLVFLETATELVGAAAGDAEGVVAQMSVARRRRHAEILLPMVAQLVEAAGTSLRDLEAIAVDVGPGLFTGLRVGVSAAKGLAQGLGLGVVGLSSLDVLARAARDAGWCGPLVCVVDARRGEVFAARYEGVPPGPAAGELGRAAPAVLRAPEVLVDELRGRCDDEAPTSSAEPLLAVGDGARRYGELLSRVPGVCLGGPTLWAPPPGAGVLLAAERLAGGQTPQAPAALVPNYLRQADARSNWVRRAGPPSEP